jgi:hypothetical protein
MNMEPDRERITFPEVVEQPIRWGHPGWLHHADDHKAIVSPRKGKLFSIVSKDYRLIRHEEATEAVEGVLNDSGGLGSYEVRTDFYNEGGRMRRTYRFPDVSVEIEPHDHINPELHLFNSYDKTWPFIVLLGAFRMVCTNGLVVGEEFLHLRKRHVFTLDQANLKEEISTALSRFSSQAVTWREWAEGPMTAEVYAKVMNEMQLGVKAKEEVNDRIGQEAGGNDNGFPVMSLWVFFNVLTWFITHRAVSLNHRVKMERSLRAAFEHLRG